MKFQKEGNKQHDNGIFILISMYKATHEYLLYLKRLKNNIFILTKFAISPML
jgi:hypothetical protein